MYMYYRSIVFFSSFALSLLWHYHVIYIHLSFSFSLLFIVIVSTNTVAPFNLATCPTISSYKIFRLILMQNTKLITKVYDVSDNN